MSARGLIVSAPRSGAGKTTVTLGLLAALRRRGIAVRAAKSGPDYIDPAFHAVATGRASLNLDSWAMPPALLDALMDDATDGADLLVIEGAMGLFDGVPWNVTPLAEVEVGIETLVQFWPKSLVSYRPFTELSVLTTKA